jgi:MFS family permease
LKLPLPLRPFASRFFLIYWAGQAISFVGTWMQQMAQSWVVTRLTDSASIVGALALVGAVPMALLGLKGGQLADKSSRRNILLITQAALGLLALGLSILAFAGKLALPHLFVFAACHGVVTAFDLPAAQALSPELVPQEEIPRAIGLMQAIFHGSRFIGPALAGIAIERLGEGSAFLANAISFMAVIVSLLAIPASPRGVSGAPARPASKGGGGGASKGSGGIGEGMRYVRGEPVVGRLLLLLFTCMLLAFPFLVSLMGYYARYVVSAGPADMGRVMSTSGLGALAGTALLVFVGGRAWRARITAGLVFIAGALVGLGSVRTIGAALPLVAGLSLGISLYLGTIMQVVQERVPNELRGRVMAVFTVGMTSLMPLSSFVLALCADAVGLPRMMIGCGAAFGAVSLMLALSLPSKEAAPPPSKPSEEIGPAA